MTGEQEVVSDCFNNFSVFFQTCASYGKTTFVFLDLLAFLEYLSSLIRYRIYDHFGAHHLSVSQVSVKRNIRQSKN